MGPLSCPTEYYLTVITALWWSESRKGENKRLKERSEKCLTFFTSPRSTQLDISNQSRPKYAKGWKCHSFSEVNIVYIVALGTFQCTHHPQEGSWGPSTVQCGLGGYRGERYPRDPR